MLELNANSSFFENKSILITGGTGTFGYEITRVLLEKFNPKKIIIYSRDEFKQYNMKKLFSETTYPQMRYFIGDVRDKERLLMALNGVDIVFHAAALKQVDTIEYNPFEAVKTNIYGTQNLIDSAIINNVKFFISVSTDKAVSPVNLYGATKLCLEKLTIAGNNYSGGNTKFSVLRYGNVLGSRGSVVPVFLEQSKNNVFTVTEPNMTRFTLTINQAINFVLNCASIMKGGEIFIPKLPSYNILQLCKIINIDAEIKIIGIRPGEKIHEFMIGQDEAYKTIDMGNYYIISENINNGGQIKYYSSGENEIIDNSVLLKLIQNI
jgi:UDP-N-acetylglucosamine 4,6-dehydratase